MIRIIPSWDEHIRGSSPVTGVGHLKLVSLVVLGFLAACSSSAGSTPSPSTAGAPPAGSGGLGPGGAGASAGATSGAGAGAAAVGGAGPASGSIPATFDTFKKVVNDAPCLGAGCHNDDQNPLNLRTDAQLYTRLTSRISKNCGGLPIVNPGKPQESALLKILKGPCGPTPRMPLGCVEDGDGSCIPADYIAALTQWIASGAPQQ